MSISSHNYSVDEEKLICNKLWEIVSILQELGEARTSIKKLRNHPIHDFTDFLKGFAFEGYQIPLLPSIVFCSCD